MARTVNWGFVHWAMDHHDWWLAAIELDAGDDFECTREQADGLRPWLHTVGLDVVVDDSVGRGYVMTIEEACRLGPAGPAYGSHPLEELTAVEPMFLGCWDDDEPTIPEAR